jgi:hypothetical protein
MAIFGAAVGLIPFNQMGEGLQNIALAYIEEEEADLDDENENGTIQQANAENIPEENNENAFQLMEDVNMGTPQEAHLIIGRVETSFFLSQKNMILLKDSPSKA